MSTTTATSCCPTEVLPVVNNYQGTGTTLPAGTLPDFPAMTLYQSAAASSTTNTAVIVIYDVFGHSGHVEQFVDRLATRTGYTVVAPNYLPDAWPVDNVPVVATGKFPAGVEPADGINALYGWIMSLPQDQTPMVRAVEQYLQSSTSIEKVGLVGMCFGAKVAFNAAQAGVGQAVAGCHAAFLTAADVENTHVPMCLLNSKDETYDAEVKPALEAKTEWADRHLYKNFPTMHHGWMGSRGTHADTDFANTEVVEKFLEGIEDLGQFFTKALAP